VIVATQAGLSGEASAHREIRDAPGHAQGAESDFETVFQQHYLCAVARVVAATAQ